ncbi:MAG: phosphoribosylaminoimidazolesuccinocarboxamide synthase [Parcubacteria group bacterium]
MATKFSPVRAAWPKLPGLRLLSQGKIRDTYELDGDLLLQVATDGISIYEFLLNALIPMKGIIITAMTVFWFRFLEKNGVKTDLVAAGAEIDYYLPEHLRNNPDLQSRAIVVKRLAMADGEFIWRGYITGSGYKAYKETGKVCGHELPPGLEDGDKLPEPLDTPTSKAKEGHDEHLDAFTIRKKYPEQTALLMKVFEFMTKYALTRGINLIDGKLEISEDGILADEISPDSCRFCDAHAYKESRRKSPRVMPQSMDKQVVRNWGKTVGIDKRDPQNPEDVNYVHRIVVPKDVIWNTTAAYRYIFWRLTDMKIEEYLCAEMEVDYSWPEKTIAIIAGSESDLPSIKNVVCPYDPYIMVHVMSCHRNPKAVMDYMANLPEDTDFVIGVGGKAFALPGILAAWAHEFERGVFIGGVALGSKNNRSLLAAKFSLTELPERQVLLDPRGKAYTGEQGLHMLLERIVNEELPPPPPWTNKPCKMNIAL